jgi:PPM family protein phosphatase
VTIAWRAAGGTHVGRVRPGNQDALHVDTERGIFLVADGMGGHAAGEVASRIAVEVVSAALAEVVDGRPGPDEVTGALERALRDAERFILEHAARDRSTSGMGTTLTAGVLSPEGWYRIGHVGDSRAYLLRDGALAQLTRDHTWVQREVDEGRLTPSRAHRHPLSHILTRALGSGPEAPDLVGGRTLPDDVLLLATDGLTGPVGQRTLTRIVAAARTPGERVERLIRAANRRGGRDNITAVVVEILDGEDAPGRAPPGD